MKFLPVFAACALACFGAPAFAQSVMTDFSFAELRTALDSVKAKALEEGQDDKDGARYLEAKDEQGLTFYIYGQQCDNKTPAQRCRGAEITTSFQFEDKDDIPDALDEIDYVAVDDAANDEGIRLTRYVIFDEGITPGNLRVNLEVFISIADKVWKLLSDEDYLK